MESHSSQASARIDLNSGNFIDLKQWVVKLEKALIEGQLTENDISYRE